jgi:outer membrane protein assembly factor BamB
MAKISFLSWTSLLLWSATIHAADWPCWGGNGQRNQINRVEKNLPTEWDIASGKNIKWSAALGSQSYGNPVIVDGRIYVGTNNESQRNPDITGDKGVVMCFDEKDGQLLWQAVHDKLSAGRVNDWPLQGICSSPYVESDRVYYVNNRCELVCVDANGFQDGNDGMTDETYQSKLDADVIWSLDMMEELGVFPHNLATSSPVIHGDLVLILTSNGVDEGHLNIPSPAAPSFLAVNKHTGEIAWESNLPGKGILHGQWSSPAVGIINGKAQAIFPGGDGWVYSLSVESGELIWKFDCNPKDSKWELGGFGTRNNLISTPAVHDNKVFIGVGQDPEHGTGIGHFHAIDATKTGDITATGKLWHFGNKDFGRTMSTPAIADGLVYIGDLDGYLFCLDANTGKQLWKHDLLAALWGSPMLVDGKIYIGDEDGDINILQHGRELKVINEINMGGTVYSTPSPANGVLYIATKSTLFAIAVE